MARMTRRTLLQLTATAVPGLAVGCSGGFDPDSVPESTQVFPRTPISGDVTSTRAVVTFHVAKDQEVTFRVWTADEVVLDEVVEPNGDGFHKFILADLTPATTYRYAAFTGKAPNFEERGLIGTFTTAPKDDATPVVRLAMVSCIGQGTILPDYYMPEGTDNPTAEPFHWPLFEQARDFELDGLVHLGDQAYLDFVWSHQEGTLEAYLNAWGYYHGGGYRELYPLAPLYASWDDHESTDNSKFDPWDMTPEDQIKLANAQEAWFKVIPIDATEPGPIWRNFRWGKTVELLLLDCRYELTEDQLMSEAQLQWLLDAIAASPCRFLCIATPKPFAAITTSIDLFADNADRWENYPPQRERLTRLLDDNDLRNVVFVTGDIHMNYLGRASITGDAPSQMAWEVCTTSGNMSPLANGLSNEQFPFVDNSPHFPVLTFDPDAGTVHIGFYASDGTLSYEQILD